MKQRDLIIARILLAMGAATILFAPYFITKYSWLDLTQTGQIGDTIGGITSPITNIIGAALVFYALKAQIESNELTRKQFEKQELNEVDKKSFQYLSEQISIVRSEINEFSFVLENDNGEDKSTHIIYKGAPAVEKLLNMLPNWIGQVCANGDDPFQSISLLMSLKLLLTSILSTMRSIDASKISKEDKFHLKSMLSYQYHSKIKSAFEASLKNHGRSVLFDIGPNETSKSIFTDDIMLLVEEIDSTIK